MTVLTGGVLANQHGMWEGWNTVCIFFSMHYVPSLPVFMFWSNVTGMGLAAMSVQDELICVCRVMPHCMFSMQLFFSEIVKFHFD